MPLNPKLSENKPDDGTRENAGIIYGDKVHGDKVAGDKIAGNKIVQIFQTVNLKWLLLLFGVTIAGILAIIFLVLPARGPVTMDGDFNIAIADFGLIDENNQVTSSEFGSEISQSIFDQLQREYEQNADLLVDVGGRIQIWHDSLPGAEKGVKFGLIEGATPAARTEQAAALARQIQADMVLYGYLSEPDDPDSVIIEFYYDSAKLRGDVDTIVGRHLLGAGIPIPISFEDDAFLARQSLRLPLALRTRALFWLSLALTLEAVGQEEQALRLLQQAEADLAEWPDDDGKEILHYFLGREAFLLREYDLAILNLERAIGLNAGYVNAYITLGSTYFDRAQLHFLRGVDTPIDQSQCISTENVENSAVTIEDALADIAEAKTLFAQAILIAPDSPFPPLIDVARLMLGLNHRLESQALLASGELSLAEPPLDAALVELEPLEERFAAASLYQFAGHSNLALGVTYHTKAHIQLANGDLEASRALFAQAQAEYSACIAQGENTPADLFLQEKIINCSCRPFEAEVVRILQEEFE